MTAPHQHVRTPDGIDNGDLLIVCAVCGAVLERLPDSSPWVTDEMTHYPDLEGMYDHQITDPDEGNSPETPGNIE